MSARRTLLISYIDRYASIIVAFAASVIIARLLTPVEVGIFSVSMVLVGFLSPFRDFGASQYVIQCKELNSEVLSSTRAIQYVLGMLLALIILISSGLVADFYKEPRIFEIMLLLAVNSLFMPVGALSMALLNREVRFKEIALIRFSAASSAAIISVVLAWQGFGPISLAYGALAGAATTSIGAIYCRPINLPWFARKKNVGHIIGFGGAITGISLLGMLRSNVAELTLARLQGLAMSGLFGRAQGLITMLQSLLMDGAYSAALPLFSKALRENRPLAPIYLNAVGIIAAVGWSIFGLVACIASPLFYILYGEQWLEAAPVAQSLCIALMFGIPNLLSQAPLIAMGKVNIVLGYVAFATVLQVVMVFFAAQYSLHAVGLAIIATAMTLVVPFFAILQRALQFNWRDLWKVLSHSAFLAAMSMLLPFILFLEFANRTDHSIARILLSMIGSAIGFTAAAILTHHPIENEIRLIISALRKFLIRRPIA